MRAVVFAVAGFVLLVVGAADFVFGGGVLAFFVLPVAIAVEVAAAYGATRVLLRRGAGRGAAVGALLVAVPVGALAVTGLVALFAPQH